MAAKEMNDVSGYFGLFLVYLYNYCAKNVIAITFKILCLKIKPYQTMVTHFKYHFLKKAFIIHLAESQLSRHT